MKPIGRVGIKDPEGMVPQLFKCIIQKGNDLIRGGKGGLEDKFSIHRDEVFWG